MARFTSLATAILILAGALVTSTGSGLSVPDWPLSFGTLFPPMVGGVRFEHTHRLIAGSVALLTILLAVMIWRGSSARLPRVLVAWAVVAVLLQALLGGLTVLLKLPLVVSAAHGTLAQTFFCMVVALAMFLSPAWRETVPREADAGASRLRTLALVTFLAIWIQLVIAAVMRHMGAGLAIPDFPLAYGQWLPPFWTPMVAVHFAHRVMAVIVFGLAMATTVTIMRRPDATPSLRGAALRLGLLVSLQVVLGAVTIWSARHPHVTSLHVANGALVLVTSLVVALWTRRLWNQDEAVGVDDPNPHRAVLAEGRA